MIFLVDFRKQSFESDRARRRTLLDLIDFLVPKYIDNKLLNDSRGLVFEIRFAVF